MIDVRLQELAYDNVTLHFLSISPYTWARDVIPSRINVMEPSFWDTTLAMIWVYGIGRLTKEWRNGMDVGYRSWHTTLFGSRPTQATDSIWEYSAHVCGRDGSTRYFAADLGRKISLDFNC